MHILNSTGYVVANGGIHVVTIENAIEQLKTEYAEAQKSNFIYNPLAYALYQVWRTADTDKENRRQLPQRVEDSSPKLYLDITGTVMPGNGYIHCTTVSGAKDLIVIHEKEDMERFTLIDMPYNAGRNKIYGGDYVQLLHWLHETGRNYPIRVHGDTPYYRSKLRKVIREYGFVEVK